MTAPQVISLGCRLNAFEAELIREQGTGLENTVIINSCAVTAEAERQTRQTIRRTRRDNPDARLIVTGCAVQLVEGREQVLDAGDPRPLAAHPGDGSSCPARAGRVHKKSRHKLTRRE